ncbi:hypothetical protein AB1Y20_018060 [Prymnesium parvum]|uniref:K Homology domain-containing protein n=1 Tax=Prymnesium parvum TaxID=97485 RepID=A0AB34JQN8_PRYPA
MASLWAFPSRIQRRPRSSGTAAALATLGHRTMCTRPPNPLLHRAAYPHFERIQTRWNDNDAFGHINNAVYYCYMDNAVNSHILSKQQPDDKYKFPRFVAESSCKYLAPLSYPSPIDVGLRLFKLGRSSVEYRIGIFAADSDRAAALGTFVHVYVDADGKSKEIPPSMRAILSRLEASDPQPEALRSPTVTMRILIPAPAVPSFVDSQGETARKIMHESASKIIVLPSGGDFGANSRVADVTGSRLAVLRAQQLMRRVIFAAQKKEDSSCAQELQLVLKGKQLMGQEEIEKLANDTGVRASFEGHKDQVVTLSGQADAIDAAQDEICRRLLRLTEARLAVGKTPHVGATNGTVLHDETAGAQTSRKRAEGRQRAPRGQPSDEEMNAALSENVRPDSAHQASDPQPEALRSPTVTMRILIPAPAVPSFVDSQGETARKIMHESASKIIVLPSGGDVGANSRVADVTGSRLAVLRAQQLMRRVIFAAQKKEDSSCAQELQLVLKGKQLMGQEEIEKLANDTGVRASFEGHKDQVVTLSGQADAIDAAQDEICRRLLRLTEARLAVGKTNGTVLHDETAGAQTAEGRQRAKRGRSNKQVNTARSENVRPDSAHQDGQRTVGGPGVSEDTDVLVNHLRLSDQIVREYTSKFQAVFNMP